MAALLLQIKLADDVVCDCYVVEILCVLYDC